MARNPEEAALAVWDALQRLVREILLRKPAAETVRSRIEALELRLELPLEGTADPARFARELAGSLDRELDRAVLELLSFRLGQVWCHRCGRADCEHSLPPSGRHVFTRYAPTGQPIWSDFAQYCLERKHPEVDRLYDDPPALLSILDDRHVLAGSLVDAFRRPGPEILGQLAAGFFPVRTVAEEGRGVIAVSIQAVRVRTGRAERVAIHVVGRSPFGGSLDELWQRHDDLPWRKAIRWAQNAADTIRPSAGGRRLPASREELDRRIAGILQAVAQRLEREHRGRGRRTRHAERRRESGTRPTDKALEDARTAAADAFLVDERSGTVVVLGDRGRTHFFTPDGRLVSSVRYSRDAIERKVKLEVWRRAGSEVAEALRAKLPV